MYSLLLIFLNIFYTSVDPIQGEQNRGVLYSGCTNNLCSLRNRARRFRKEVLKKEKEDDEDEEKEGEDDNDRLANKRFMNLLHPPIRKTLIDLDNLLNKGKESDSEARKIKKNKLKKKKKDAKKANKRKRKNKNKS